MDEFHIQVSDYEFACFVEVALRRMGLEATGAGIELATGRRDLHYNKFPIPPEFIPEPIAINLPEDAD